METSYIRELITKGENQYVEFKREEIKNEELAEEITAFSNSDGGVILIGIDDNGTIIGINENIEERIMNVTRDSCFPRIIPFYEEVFADEKRIAIVTIPKGLNKPYYTIDNKYYIRMGSTKRIASKDELLRLFEISGAYHFDISIVPNSGINNRNIDIIRDYYMRYNSFDLYEEGGESRLKILENADILNFDGEKYVCTVGGLLIFGKKPEEMLPQNGISFAHFRGMEISGELIDKKIITGRIQDIAEQAMTVLKNNIINPSTIDGLRREEKEFYPLTVLREALVNALVHRNYSISGSSIRIFMFDDRIEFRSPGRLPNTVSVEKMKIGVSFARNPFLVKYMENMRYIDQLGRGIPLILKQMKELGARIPEMREEGEEFILTIYKAG